MQAGRTPEAIQQYAEALRLQPDLVEAHNNLGMALGQSGRLPEAIAELKEALRLRPDYVEAHTIWATPCCGPDGGTRRSSSMRRSCGCARTMPRRAETWD